jgi:hypothetical protein
VNACDRYFECDVHQINSAEPGGPGKSGNGNVAAFTRIELNIEESYPSYSPYPQLNVDFAGD